MLGTAHHFVAALYTGLGPEFLEEAKAHAKAYAAELFEIAKPKAPAAAGVAQDIVPAAVQPVAPAAAPEPVQPVLEPGTALATPAAVAAAVAGVVVGAPAAAVAAIPVQGAEPSGASDIAW